MLSENTKNQAILWIQEAIGTSNLQVSFKERQDNLEGFMADTLLAEVVLENNEVLHVFIKMGRMNATTKAPIVTECSKREIFFYRNILSTYQRFLKEKHISDKFLYIPKCYKTFLSDKEEVIVLEDVKQKGYQIFNRHLPMNLSHIRMVLKALAQLHSLSFALKAQKPQEFDKLSENYTSILGPSLAIYKDSFNNRLDKLIEKFVSYEKHMQADKVEKLKKLGVADVLQRIISDKPEEAVVLHADSHNNNFMFQYEDSNKEEPSNLLMVDFQLSFLHSPVIDLCYFWYFVASTEEYPHLTELLEFYHKELSLSLKKLGNNVDEIFPLDTLWRHWKKYSIYGFIQALLFTYLLYVDNEDLEKIDDGSGGTKVQQLVGLKLKHDEAYVQRVTALIDHYQLE